MMMKKTVKIAFAATVLSMVCAAVALPDVKPVQLAIYPPLQLFDADTSILGVRLSIHGINRDVTGIDVGIVPKVTGNMNGWQTGFINIVEGDMLGYQDGFINIVGGSFTGWQSAFINICKRQNVGLQSGFINLSGGLNGIQFGLTNIAESLNGLQVGLVNLNKSGKPHRFLPIVNFSF